MPSWDEMLEDDKKKPQQQRKRSWDEMLEEDRGGDVGIPQAGNMLAGRWWTPNAKAPNSREPLGPFGKILDVLNRGSYVSANVAKDLVNGGGFSPLDDIWRGLNPKNDADRGSYADVVGQLWPGAPDWAKAALGGVADYALDPTTYLGGGLTTLGKFAKVMRSAPEIVAESELGAKMASRVATAAAKSGEKGVARAATQAAGTTNEASKIARAKVAVQGAAQPVKNLFAKFMKNPKALENEVAYQVNLRLEHGRNLDQAIEEVANASGGALDAVKVRVLHAAKMKGKPLPNAHTAPKTFAEKATVGEAGLLNVAGKPVIKGAGVAQVVGKGIQAAKGTELGDALAKTFSTNYGPLAPEKKDLRRTLDYITNQQVAENKPIRDELNKLIESTGLTNSQLYQVYERPLVRERITKRIKEMAEIPNPDRAQELQNVEALKQEIFDEKIRDMRMQVEAGSPGRRVPVRSMDGRGWEAIAERSSYPDWMKGRGWTKVRVLKAIDSRRGQLWEEIQSIARDHLDNGHAENLWGPDPYAENRGQLRQLENDYRTHLPETVTTEVEKAVPADVTVNRREQVGQPVVNFMKMLEGRNAANLTREHAAGITTPELDVTGIEYMGRFLDPAAKKLLQRQAKDVGPNPFVNVMHGSTKTRTTREFTVPELNQAWREGRLVRDPESGELSILPQLTIESAGKTGIDADIAAGGKAAAPAPSAGETAATLGEVAPNSVVRKPKPAFGKLKDAPFIENVAVAQGLRDIRSARAVAMAEWLQNVKQKYGKSIDQAKAEGLTDWRPVKNQMIDTPQGPIYWNPFGTILKDTVFPQDVADELGKVILKARNVDDPLGPLFDLAKGGTQFWKGIATSLRPAFHVRNAAGNLWNNALVGATNPLDYLTAALGQTGKGSNRVIEGAGGTKYTLPEVMELAARKGVTGRGQFAGDWEKSVIDDLVKPKKTGPVSFMREKVGQPVEDNARLANFIGGLKQGLSPEDAAARVNQALFDYGDLTDAERKIRATAVPFYTWYRKNLPLQMRGLWEKPGQFAAIPKAMNAVETAQGGGDDKTGMPAWAAENLPVQVGDKYLPLRWWIPGADVASVENPLGTVMGLMNPLATLAYEEWQNRDTYTGQPLEGFLREPKSVMGVPLPGQVAEAVNTLLPPVRELSGVIQPKQGATTPDALLGLLTGYKPYAINLGASEGYSKLDIADQLREAHKALNKAEEDGDFWRAAAIKNWSIPALEKMLQ